MNVNEEVRCCRCLRNNGPNFWPATPETQETQDIAHAADAATHKRDTQDGRIPSIYTSIASPHNTFSSHYTL